MNIQRGDGLFYAYIFEPKPGKVWVSTRFSHKICPSLQEADFMKK